MLDQSKRISSRTPPTESEPTEFTLLRETMGKAADAIETVRDEWIEKVQQITVPKPPLLAGRPVRNPFTWILDGFIGYCRDDMLQEAINLFRLEANTSYLEVIYDMLASGDPLWADESEDAT